MQQQDIDYNAVFGLEDEGENGQELADLSNQQSESAEDEGENVQEAAQPAEVDADAPEEYAQAPDAKEEADQSPRPQSPEENARYAAIRRKAEKERDEAIQKAKEQAQKEMDEVFKASGMVNPYTQKPILSKAEFDDYRSRFESEKIESAKRKMGLGDEEWQKFVSAIPEVRAARQEQEKAQQEILAARRARADAQVQEQLRQIAKLDPSIRSLEDLVKQNNYDAFLQHVKQGNTLLDAFRLANFDALTQRAGEMARTRALEQAHGKDHMQRTTARGEGAISVPESVKAEYRAFNPGITDAEIQAHYSKYMKKKP